MSYVIQTAMHERTGAAEGMVWHSDSLGVTLLLHAAGKVRGIESRKSLLKEIMSWREYWQHLIDARLAYTVRTVSSYKFWWWKDRYRNRQNVHHVYMSQGQDGQVFSSVFALQLPLSFPCLPNTYTHLSFSPLQAAVALTPSKRA